MRTYMSGMSVSKRSVAKPTKTAGQPARIISWSVHQIASKMRLVGFVDAPDDEASALREALRVLEIPADHHNRIVVRRSAY